MIDWLAFLVYHVVNLYTIRVDAGQFFSEVSFRANYKAQLSCDLYVSLLVVCLFWGYGSAAGALVLTLRRWLPFPMQ